VTKLSGFQRSGSEMFDFWKLKKYNKSVKNYVQMKFESEDLIYQPRGIQNAIKWVVLLIPLKDMVFGKKSSTNQSGVFYEPLDNLHSSAARRQQDSCGILM
jgi:hypothetical protein